VEQDENMDCRQVTDDMLLDYAEGELPRELQAELKAHLAKCESCLARSQEISAISVAMLESGELNEDIPIPGRVDAAVLETIREVAGGKGSPAGKRRVFGTLIRIAAGVCIIVIAGFLLIRGQADHKRAAEAPDMMTEREAEAGKPRETGPADMGRQGEGKRTSVELAAARREIQKLTSRMAGLEQELAAEKEKTTSLTASLETSDENQDKLREELDRVTADYEGLKGQGDEMLAGLKRKVADMTEYVAKLEGRIGDLLAQMDDTVQKYRGVQVEAADARSRLAAVEQEKAGLERRLLVAGDINRDRKADAADAMIIVDKLLSKGSVEYSAEGDANGDGKIDIGDALAILNKALVE
jgi:DNA repair exonuclease SbcCD ATPase subunit